MRSIRFFIKRFLHLFLFIILIFLSVLLLLNAQNKILQNIKSFGFTFFSSFQLGFSGITDAFSGVSIYFGEVAKLKKELAETQNMLHETYQKLDELEDLKKQNIQLRGIIGYSFTIPSLYDNVTRVIRAMVIAKQPGNFSSCMTINKGKKDGVRINMPVITPYDKYQGLVGKIIIVGNNTSIILPLYNNSCYIAAKFNETDYEGLVNGLGENTSFILMQYVDKNAKSVIRYGDLVVSSGLGQLYPKGIHIGKVKAIKAKPFETSMECEIEPVVDFSRIENVFVISQRK